MWIASILSILIYPIIVYMMNKWLDENMGTESGFSRWFSVFIIATIIDTIIYYVLHWIINL
jgi:phosphotransferase system  glucose/maltose/N-acetylglucosamine-specific IIC component